MKEYVLSCCSTADMPRSWFEERNIPFACFHFTMDGVQYDDDLGKSMSFEEFYRRVGAGAMPTTSQVNVNQYVEFFRPFLAAGKDVLHLTLSSGISGSYNSACIAAQELEEQYPDNKVYVVDSLAASSGFGLLMDLAADRRDAGMPLEELRQWVLDNRLNLNHWFFSTNLTHYKRGGRISTAAAVAGTLLNICPLLNVNDEGKLIIRQKVRGKRNVIKEIVEKMKQHAEGGTEYSGKCFISNSACMEDARAVADLVEAAFPHLQGKVMINSIGTVIGSHTGPGTVALFFVGDKRER